MHPCVLYPTFSLNSSAGKFIAIIISVCNVVQFQRVALVQEMIRRASLILTLLKPQFALYVLHWGATPPNTPPFELVYDLKAGSSSLIMYVNVATKRLYLCISKFFFFLQILLSLLANFFHFLFFSFYVISFYSYQDQPHPGTT